MNANGWQYIPFTKAAKVISDEGRRVKQRDYLPTGKVPVIDQGQEFIGGYVNDENMSFKGDLPVIIFGDHTRNIKFVTRPFAVGAEGVKILKPDPFYEPKFFYYFLHTLDITSRGYSRHFQFLRKFDFPLAPLNQQKRIVAEIEKQFSRLDEAVAALKRIQTNLKRYKASVLKAAVEGKLTEQWRMKNPDVEPAGELLNRILTERRKKWEEDYVKKYIAAHGYAPKDDSWKKKYKEPAQTDTSNMPELPKGWVWASLDQLSDQSRAITYGVIKLGSHLQDGIPTLRSSNVRHLYLEMEGVKRISPALSDAYSRTILHGGEVLVTVRGTLGGVINVPKTCAGFNISREVAMIAPLSSISPKCLAILMGSKQLQNWLARNTKGIAYTGINIETLKITPVPLMSLDEQHEITQIVEHNLSVIDEMELNLETNLKRAERLRQSILKKAFSGRLIQSFGKEQKHKEGALNG